jgi:outer membrane receptor protein involved in Fe transport
MIALAMLLGLNATAAELPLEEVVVRGTFRSDSLEEVAASVSLLPARAIEERAAQHVEQLLNLAPNVNIAAGASRGRFVQIRGVGERSQFVDPVDPSVGLVIDGIDLSGVGNAATLFDIEQVEVFRGPQGTRFGASAMGGLVVMHSAPPTEAFAGRVEAGLGDYGARRAGVVLSGPLRDGVGGRLAVHRHLGDGYMRNLTLGRDDTADFDETTVRARLQASLGVTEFDLSWLHLDVDNGYDAFTLDNSRQSLADEPGRDRQRTDALALRAERPAGDLTLQATLSVEHSDLDYGFDEDWSFAGLCAGAPCEGFEYASTDRYLRDRRAGGAELRLSQLDSARGAWTVGLYAYRRDVALERRFFDFVAFQPATLFTDYEHERLAAFGDWSGPWRGRWQLGAGLRVERVTGDYRDSLDVHARPDELLWGGQLSLRYRLSDAWNGYARLSRGYKAGGVNGEALGRASAGGLSDGIVDFLRARLTFDAETLYNAELGVAGELAGGRLRLRGAAFYMDRDEMQNRAWYSDGPAFVGYLDNASGGHNLGLEFEATTRLADGLELRAALGLLDSELGSFIANDPDLGFVDKAGREQAHAPAHQFSLAARWEHPAGWYGRLEWEGRDAFYFSNSHDARSDAYALWHATAGLRWRRLDVSLWGRNLGDADYAVRGFRFGNDPRDFYAVKTYVQWGAPRTVGATARYRF